MIDLNTYTVIGLQSKNSTDYVRLVFESYKRREIIFALKEKPESNKVSGIYLNKFITPEDGAGWINAVYEPDESDLPAQIVFTSGTEGEPKGIVLSHRSLSDVAFRLNLVMEIDSTISEYIGVPVNYSFGLGRCRAVSIAGGKCFLPSGGFNPIEIRKMLEEGRINAISAVPTLWRIILDSPGQFMSTGSRVKWIEIGSQFMSRQEKEQMKRLFPKARIVQHYGLTEASRTTFLKVHEAKGMDLESVGKPIGDVEVSISKEARILIRGPHTAIGKLVNGYVSPLIDDKRWLETSDFGCIKNDLLFYEGRADDVINSGGVKISPEYVERKANESLGRTLEFALCRIPSRERGDTVLVAIKSTSQDSTTDILNAVNTILLNQGVNTSNSLKHIVVDEFPVTNTGKIQRKQLAKEFHLASKGNDTIHGKSSNNIVGVFSDIFPETQIKENNTFVSLGGDSLNYVLASMKIEQILGFLPENWEKKSINELEAMPASYNKLPMLEMNILLRAIAILCVVATHSGFSITSGGTNLLFVLVGYNLARFQSYQMMSGKVWSSIFSYARNILIPYAFLIIAYLIWKHEFGWDLIFMYSNLISLDDQTPAIFPAWFVEVLIQCLLVLGLLFSIERIRLSFIKNTWQSSFIILAGFIILRYAFPYIYDTNYLYQRVPPIFISLIWLGWCIYFSETRVQKTIIIVAVYVLAYIHLGLNIKVLWVLVGGSLLVLVPYIRVPEFIKIAATIVGAATFYLYLFHMLFMHLPVNVLKLESPMINMIAACTGSIGVWYLSEKISHINFLRLVKKEGSM